MTLNFIVSIKKLCPNFLCSWDVVQMVWFDNDDECVWRDNTDECVWRGNSCVSYWLPVSLKVKLKIGNLPMSCRKQTLTGEIRCYLLGASWYFRWYTWTRNHVRCNWRLRQITQGKSTLSTILYTSVYTPHYYSLYGVVEFILLIITPCTGWWSLYSTLLLPVQGGGVYTPHY